MVSKGLMATGQTKPKFTSSQNLNLATMTERDELERVSLRLILKQKSLYLVAEAHYLASPS